MRVVDLALKDLSQILRDKRSLLFLVGMPVAFTLFMGFAYRGGDEGQLPDQHIPLVVVNPEPNARLNQMLLARLELSDGLRLTSLAEADAMAALRDGAAAGVLIIPAGYTEQAESGMTPQLRLIAEAASTQGQALYQLLRVPVSQVMSAVAIGHSSAELAGDAAEYEPALALAWHKWVDNAGRSLVRVERASSQPPADWTGGNPYNQASPGILVQFAIFGLITSAQILVQERQGRTLQRMLTTAMRPWEILAGHWLAMFSLTFLQTVLLVAFAQLALDVNYLREPLATLLLCVALGLWVASLGLLIGVVARQEQQVILISMVAMFLFSALGGTWFPLESAGGTFAAIGRLMPSAWAMNGLQNIIIRGLALGSVLLPAGILLAYAAGFFGLAVWQFRRLEP